MDQDLQDFVDLLIKDSVDENLTLPDPALVQFYDDMRNRIVWINGEINKNSLDVISQIVRWNREDKEKPIKERKPIRLLFYSQGGDLDVEETLVSVIRLSKTPIYGIALGMVASAASLIFLSCHKRYALPNAYLILHKGSMSNVGANYNELMAAMDDYREQIEKMINFYIENTGYTEEEVRKNIMTDWYIRGKELYEKGIITGWIEDIEVLL